MKYFVLAFILALFAIFAGYLDLESSGWFYRMNGGQFYDNALTDFIFKYGPWPAFILGFTALFIFIFDKKRRRASLVVILAGILGVGLLIHGIKDCWGRPRPIQIEQFGGKYQYSPFYLPREYTGEKMRGFPSGHAASGFMFLSLVVLGLRYRNKYLLLAGWVTTTILGGGLSITRMAQGKHFFSDVFMSLVLMWLAVIVLDKICHKGQQ
jgi:lipid A 4'-phosphatase